MKGLTLSSIAVLGWRNLWRNYRRTLIMLLSIAVGIWAMIFMTAMLRGMVDQLVVEGIRDLPGQVQIHHPRYRDDPSIVNSIAPPAGHLLTVLNGKDVSHWSTRVKVPAVVSSERDSRGVFVVGVDPVVEQEALFFQDEIIAGRYIDAVDDKGLVIGKKLAKQLETDLGKRVVLMSQDPENNIADRGFRVVGIYQARLEEKEAGIIYAGRATLQRLLKMDGQVSEVAVVGDDNYLEVDDLLTKLVSASEQELEILPWQQLNPFLSGARDVMQSIVLIWIVVVFLALSFGLVNTLMMAVFERIREIGLMMALGMRPGNILLQVLVESFILLLIGLAVGNFLAVVTIKSLSSGIDISRFAEGMQMVGAGTVLYPTYQLQDIFMANGTVILLGLLTSLIPAWRASRFDPIQALRKT